MEKKEDSYVLTLDDGQQIETDYVLEATGRATNVEKLGLEDLGIDYSRRGIRVNEYLQTSVPNIYHSQQNPMVSSLF